jgi:hypothetical protein
MYMGHLMLLMIFRLIKKKEKKEKSNRQVTMISTKLRAQVNLSLHNRNV